MTPEQIQPLFGGEGVPLGQLAQLPATLNLVTAAEVLGIGRTKAYQLARDDEFPCRLIRIGDLYRVPTPELLRLLGIDPSLVLLNQLPN